MDFSVIKGKNGIAIHKQLSLERPFIVSKKFINEPPHGKTNNLHRRKERRGSVSQTAC